MLINSSKVKEFLKNKGIRCSGDLYIALNEEVKKICLKTSDNAVAKQMKTAKATHVPKVDIFLNNIDSLKN